MVNICSHLIKAGITIGSTVFMVNAFPACTCQGNNDAYIGNINTLAPLATPAQTYVQAVVVRGCNTSHAVNSMAKKQVKVSRHKRKRNKKQRKNKLYYIIDEGGCRYDLPDAWQDYLWKICRKYGIKKYYRLLIAQMYHESNFKPDEISGTDDYGLMQINRCNFTWLKNKLHVNDFLDPYDSIKSGAYMMSLYLKKYGNAHKALVCYNMGEGKVRSGITSSRYSRGVVNDLSLLKIKKKGK